MNNKTRTRILLAIRIAIILSVTLGLIFSFLSYENDGYSAWHKRLLYFTTLSGIWIAILSLVMLIYKPREGSRGYEILCALRLILTVSITLTGAVFCGFLAPFADERYHPWSYYSILNHVVTPILAIADFIICDTRVRLSGRHIALSTVPPLLYLAFSITLTLSGVDFGRGDPYPYIFLDITSPVGFFGLSREEQLIGTFWWLLALLLIVLGIAKIYSVIINRMIDRKKKN